MSNSLKTFIAAVATLCAGAAAAAADVGEFIVPVCDSRSSIVVSVKGASQVKDASAALEALADAGKLTCATPGPIAATWVLDGTPKAMLVGTLPAGVDSLPYLQVWSPRFRLIGPLVVDQAKGIEQAQARAIERLTLCEGSQAEVVVTAVSLANAHNVMAGPRPSVADSCSAYGAAAVAKGTQQALDFVASGEEFDCLSKRLLAELGVRISIHNQN